MVFLLRCIFHTLLASTLCMPSTVRTFGRGPMIETPRVLTLPASDLSGTDYRYESGRRIADGLIEGCSVLFGTITEIGEPEERTNGKYRKVKLAVHEWLWGKPEKGQSSVQVRAIIKPKQVKGSGPWTAWENVKLAVGQRLLVSVFDGTWQGSVEECVIAVTDDSVIAHLREVIRLHEQCQQDPAKLSNVASLIPHWNNPEVSGYLVEYLRRKGNEANLNNEVAVLLNLLQHQEYGKRGEPYIIKALIGRLRQSNAFTLKQAVSNLLEAGSGQDLLVAARAIEVLAALTKQSGFDIAEQLDETQRRGLVRNYQQLVANGRFAQRDQGFERQLAIQKGQ